MYDSTYIRLTQGVDGRILANGVGQDDIWTMFPADSTASDSLPPGAAALDFAYISSPIEVAFSPEQVFGWQSSLAEREDVSSLRHETSLTGNTVFSACALLLLMAYLFIMAYFREIVSELLKAAVNRTRMDKLIGEQNRLMSQFTTELILCGMLALSLSLVKYMDNILDHSTFCVFSKVELSLAAPAVMFALWAIVIYQHIAVFVVGRLTHNRPFFEQLSMLRRTSAAAGFTFVIPLSLLFVLNNSPLENMVGWLLLAAVTYMIFDIPVKTYRFFNSQKVSILHWFLYLCGVEIFPVSVFLLAAVRGGF